MIRPWWQLLSFSSVQPNLWFVFISAFIHQLFPSSVLPWSASVCLHSPKTLENSFTCISLAFSKSSVERKQSITDVRYHICTIASSKMRSSLFLLQGIIILNTWFSWSSNYWRGMNVINTEVIERSWKIAVFPGIPPV